MSRPPAQGQLPPGRPLPAAPPRRAAPPTTPKPRSLALQILRQWQPQLTHASELLARSSQKHRIQGKDHHLLLTLVLTTLRNLSLLDLWIEHLCTSKLDEDTRWSLRMALTELLILQTAPHAAVNENVALAKRAGGLINAILRRALREQDELRSMEQNAPPSLRYSHPTFLWDRWCKQFGEQQAIQLMEWNQQPAPLHIRINQLHPLATQQPASLPDLVPLAEPGFYGARQLPHQALMEGSCYAQDLSTAAAPNLLAPQPGETVLDACASPGGKTALLAQLMDNSGSLIACDLPGSRLERLRSNLERLHVRCAQVQALDWLSPTPLPFEPQTFDKILLDTPCSNTGVIRRRVDVRWRLTAEEMSRMVTLQRDLLTRILPLLKPDGVLVYSTCSIDEEENQQQIQWLLSNCPTLTCIGELVRTPIQHQSDGAYAAAIQRK